MAQTLPLTCSRLVGPPLSDTMPVWVVASGALNRNSTSMLSYRHGFHAGNHADVIKHLVQVRILHHLLKKNKPFLYLDTHAGGGGYSLTDGKAAKTGEYLEGIARIWRAADRPAPLQAYLEQVQAFCANTLTRYPGSPALASQMLRREDRMVLHELHRSELESLQRMFGKNRRVRVLAENGFVGCVAAMPPPERRGLVLIDPPYEIKSDYDQVVDMLVKAHRRFSTGVYALWFPVVDRQRIDQLEKALKRSGIASIDLYELAVRPDSDERGMNASGMVVINPPWGLRAEMETCLPWLAKELGDSGQGSYRVVELAAER